MINRYDSRLLQPKQPPSESPIHSTFAFAADPTDPLKVSFGQKTFDAEGIEGPGKFFSRRISWPIVGDSGVTIGRGYDMGRRSSAQIIRELTLAGMPENDAAYLSKAAGLRGLQAKNFVTQHLERAPIMSLETQKNLFEQITTPDFIRDIQRIFSKPDVVANYGRARWEDISPVAQELIFDLRYRGDYTAATRRIIQAALVNQDYTELRAVIDDTAYWHQRGVPSERIKARQLLAANL